MSCASVVKTMVFVAERSNTVQKRSNMRHKGEKETADHAPLPQPRGLTADVGVRLPASLLPHLINLRLRVQRALVLVFLVTGPPSPVSP